MSTIITILIIAIIAALVIVGLKETIKHSKGEGACCGGGAMKEDEEATVQLTGEIVTRADVHIDGMHCMNCKNSVTRSLQKMSGVSAAVGAQIDGMSGCTPSGMASDGTFFGTGSTDGTNGANQAAMSDRDFILKKNVDDILQHYIYQAESMIGKPMMLMNKEEKIRALDYLDQKGVFKITKTSLLLCDAMQISKYTLYNYLEEARISRKSETNE